MAWKNHPVRRMLPIASAALFVIASVVNLVFMVRGPWPEMTRASWPVEILMVGVWLAAAAGVFFRRAWAYVAAVLGAVAAAAHGAVLRFAGLGAGTFFLVIGFALLAMVIAEHREFGLSAGGTRPSVA